MPEITRQDREAAEEICWQFKRQDAANVVAKIIARNTWDAELKEALGQLLSAEEILFDYWKERQQDAASVALLEAKRNEARALLAKMDAEEKTNDFHQTSE